jgi:hypothetical protein
MLYMCQISSPVFWHMVCQIRLKWSQQRIIVKHILHNMCQMWLCAGARFTVHLQIYTSLSRLKNFFLHFKDLKHIIVVTSLLSDWLLYNKSCLLCMNVIVHGFLVIELKIVWPVWHQNKWFLFFYRSDLCKNEKNVLFYELKFLNQFVFLPVDVTNYCIMYNN